METEKRIYTHEEMLDMLLGPVGTPEKDEFDAKVKEAAREYFIGKAIKETRKKQGLTQGN